MDCVKKDCQDWTCFSRVSAGGGIAQGGAWWAGRLFELRTRIRILTFTFVSQSISGPRGCMWSLQRHTASGCICTDVNNWILFTLGQRKFPE